MDDNTLKAITDAEMRQAVGYWSGKLANQRQQAMYYYYGEAVGDLSPPEVEGRSSVVSPDVRNTVESMLPQLMVKFAGSEHPVEFEATKPGDEPKAEQATDFISYLYNVKNPGERITYSWMKDALLFKNGIVKVWWDTRSEEKREEYKGLDQIELALLADDEEVELIDQKSYPDEEDAEQRQQAIQQLTQQLQQAQTAAQQNPQAAQAAMAIQQQIAQIQSQPPAMLFDVACIRRQDQGHVCVENVPPEEFLISRKAKSIQDAPFVGHRVARSMSQLKSMGYKNIDYIGSEDAAISLNMERIQRLEYDDEFASMPLESANGIDQSQRMVWVTECYIRVDYDGDGITELRKVVRAGNEILENEVVDCAPFISITPVPMPHKFFGLSVADLAIPAQKTKTSILRGMLDNMYLEVNGRYFAVEGQVNLDDLTTSRPGGVVRVKQPGAVGRLDQGQANADLGMGMMEYMSGFLEDSTGWSRNSQGNDPQALKDPMTATQANIVTNKADMRLDLIARNFSLGFRELFNMMLKLVCQYQQKNATVKLRGQWVEVNPREWVHGFDTTINVGLGTGSKDQLVAHLSMLARHQANTFPLGVTTTKNIYELMKEMAKAMGFKSADKFFSDPAQQPPQPPKPDPEQVKAQAQMQVEQMKAQAQAQASEAERQAELQLERERMAMQAQVDTHRQQVEAQQQAMKMQQERELEQFRAQLDAQKQAQQLELERWKTEYQTNAQMVMAEMTANVSREKNAQDAQNAAATTQATAVTGEASKNLSGVLETVNQNMQNLLQGHQAIAQAVQQIQVDASSPAEIVRGPDGRAVGIKRGNQTRQIQRGPDGRMTGL